MHTWIYRDKMYNEAELLDMLYRKKEEFFNECDEMPNTLVISENYLEVLANKLNEHVYTFSSHNVTKVFGMEVITTIKKNIIEVY